MNALDLLPPFPGTAAVQARMLDALRGFVAEFPPYSDFDPLSLWAWGDTLSLGRAGGNLVVYLDGYGDAAAAGWTMLGRDRVSGWAQRLLEHTGRPGRAVPGVVAEALDERFEVVEDPDNHDYVLDLQAVAGLAGPRWAARRHEYERFLRSHGKRSEVVSLDLTDPSARGAVRVVFDAWRRGHPERSSEVEKSSFDRVLQAAGGCQLVTTGVTVDGVLAGFAVSGIRDDGWAVGHFSKVDHTHPGLGTALVVSDARQLLASGVRMLNYEQDLGLPGLRDRKARFRSGFLHKYTIRLAA